MKKPRPQKQFRHRRRAPAFDSALSPARYHVLPITYHLGSLPALIGCVISQHFVVKTTRRSKAAPFDALDDIARPHHITLARVRLPSWQAIQRSAQNLSPQEDIPCMQKHASEPESMLAVNSQARFRLGSAPLPPGGSSRFRAVLPRASGLLPGRFRLRFRRVYNLVADLVSGVLSKPP